MGKFEVFISHFWSNLDTNLWKVMLQLQSPSVKPWGAVIWRNRIRQIDRSLPSVPGVLTSPIVDIPFLQDQRTVVEVTSLRLSGISALFGLWAELTMGLEGVGMLREPTVEVLGLRIDRRSSLSPAPSPLGLCLGWADPGAAGPPETWN